MEINLEILDATYIFNENEVKDLKTKELVPQMIFRRRLTRASKLLIELLSKIEIDNNRIIYGSSFGELLSSDNILKAIKNNDILSPTDFQNSVYNTAVSYYSILTKNEKEITTISSGDETSLKVLKAGAIKALDGDEIILVCCETLNIGNIEDINSCIKYLEVAVAVKIKLTLENETLFIKNTNNEKFPMSITHILNIAKEFVREKKNIIKIKI